MGRPAVLKVDIVADAKGVKRGTDEAEGRFSKLGSSVGKVGLAIGAGMAGAAVAVGAFAASTIGAASDAQQSLGAVESVFGKAAGGIIANSNRAATAVGLSANAYREMASVVGAQLTGMGLSQAKAAKQTDDLVKMGADLSATFGGSVSDAVSAVGSLLRGEADPIERYGVSIKQADVQARLHAQGLDGLTGAALKQAQAQATLQLLQEKTRASTGAFARETDTLAHQQQVLGAQFDNVKTKIGSAIIPALTGLFTVVSTRVMPVVGRLAGELAAKLAPTVNRVAAFFRTDLLPAFRTVGAFVTDVLVPAYGRALRPVIEGVGNAVRHITDKIHEHRDSFVKLWNIVRPFVQFLVTKVLPVVGAAMGKAFGILGSAIGLVIDSVATLIDLVSGLIDKLQAVGSAIKNNPISKGIGKVGGWAFGSTQVATMTPQLVGGVPQLGPQLTGLATAAASSGDPTLAGFFGGTSRGGLVVIDQRDQSRAVRVDGALDPVGVANQVAGILGDRDARLGRVPAWGAAS
jgi:hypothetical protein